MPSSTGEKSNEMIESIWTIVLIGFGVNLACMLILVAALSFVALKVYRLRQTGLPFIGPQLVQIRKRIKVGAFSLIEFLYLCEILGITKDEAMEIYTQLHRDRRTAGESWLFDSNKKPSEGDRRRMTVFKSFAGNSQFTQGRLGYRMHHLLHRPVEYVAKSSSQHGSFYDISRLAKTDKSQDGGDGKKQAVID